MRMIKIALRNILLVFLLAGLPAGLLHASPAQAQASTMLVVSPLESRIPAGGTGRVSVEVIDGASINAFDLILRYDPAVLSLDSFSTGGFLTNLAQVKKEDELGRLRLVYTQLATAGASGSGTLLELSFTGLAPGSSEVWIESAGLAVSGGGLVEPLVSSGLVHVDPVPLATATTEPSFTSSWTATPIPPSMTPPQATNPSTETPQPPAMTPTLPAAPTATELPGLSTGTPSGTSPAAAGETGEMGDPMAGHPGSTQSAQPTQAAYLPYTSNEDAATFERSSMIAGEGAGNTDPTTTGGPAELNEFRQAVPITEAVFTAVAVPTAAQPAEDSPSPLAEVSLWAILVLCAGLFVWMLAVLASRKNQAKRAKDEQQIRNGSQQNEGTESEGNL